MPTIDVTATTSINQPASLVRAQFADVAHHQATGVHHGVAFEVLDDDGTRCRYRQTTRKGPIRMSQEMVLERSTSGPLVNEVISGALAGGSISFVIVPEGANRTRVDATVSAPLNPFQALIAPVVRSQVRRALQAALDEDRVDLEEGRYRPRAEEAARY